MSIGHSCREMRLTFNDVLFLDGDVVVAVRPVLLVPEANDVAQLVEDDRVVATPSAQGRGLPPADAANIRVAPGGVETSCQHTTHTKRGHCVKIQHTSCKEFIADRAACLWTKRSVIPRTFSTN